MKRDTMGDRLKAYERLTELTLMPRLPIIIRLDGRTFHTFTRKMARPYDDSMIEAMINTTIDLVKETNAVVGYTQSDEISLVLYTENIESETWFCRRHSKIISNLASLCGVYFYKHCMKIMPDYLGDKVPSFDCRAFNVPNLKEAYNILLWRECDAIKNSITLSAQSVYSHAQLQGKNSKDKLEMLLTAGINWQLYPENFRRGTFIKRHRQYLTYTPEELQNLPDKHFIKTNLDACKIRHIIKSISGLPILSENREESFNMIFKTEL